MAQLDRRAVVAERVARGRHRDRRRVALAGDLQLILALRQRCCVDRVVAEAVHANRLGERRAVGLQQLHGGRALQAEEFVLRAARRAVGQGHMPEQAQVAGTGHGRQHGAHDQDAVGRDVEGVRGRRIVHQRPAVAQGVARAGRALDDIGARLEIGKAQLAARIGDAAEDRVAGLLDLHLHIGQEHRALDGGASGNGECEGAGRREAQPPGAPRGAGDRRGRPADRGVRRDVGLQRIARHRVLLFDVTAPAIGNRDVREVHARPFGHRPDRLGRIAVLDGAGGCAPLILQRVAVGVAGRDLEVGLVGAAVLGIAGAPAATGHESESAAESQGEKGEPALDMPLGHGSPLKTYRLACP